MENSSNGLAAAPASSSDEPIRVLIVDDEKVVRDMLVTYLGLEGFRSAPSRTEVWRSTNYSAAAITSCCRI